MYSLSTENGKKILRDMSSESKVQSNKQKRVRVSEKMRLKNQARVDLMMKTASLGVPKASSVALSKRFARKAKKRKRERVKEFSAVEGATLRKRIQTKLDFKLNN